MGVHPGQHDVPEAAEVGVATLAEREAVADRPPQQAHQTCDAHALGHDGEDVFAAHETAVKERETGEGHKNDERGGGHLPGAVAGTGTGDLGSHALGAAGVVDVGLQVGQTLLDGGLGEGGLGGRLIRGDGDLGARRGWNSLLGEAGVNDAGQGHGAEEFVE